MYLIVGLGNPGKEYEKTRHNAGFMFLDKLAKKLNLEFKPDKYLKSDVIVVTNKFILAKPTTFMNESGTAVALLSKKFGFKLEEIHVVHDDLDIALGLYKVQQGVGPKVHNGVNDIEEKLKTTDFWRIRIGVDNRDAVNRIPGEAYVLQNFNTDELKIIDTVLEKQTEELQTHFSK
ncbi:MAG: aminoacyl-tRNA hydrolase [Patescibacteria group bacterium]